MATRINLTANPNDWRGIIKVLKTAKETVHQNAGDMSGFELRLYQSEIQEAKERFRMPAINSVIGEYHGSLAHFQAAKEKIAQERAKEIDRWDQVKLSAGMAATAQRLQMIAQASDNFPFGQSNAARVKSLFAEAMASRDDTFRRAAFETLAESLGLFMNGPSEVRSKVNAIAGESKAQLAKLRITPGMQQAAQEADQALQQAIEARDNLIRVAEEVDPTEAMIDGYGRLMPNPFAVGPLAKEFKRLWADPETGDVSILEMDDPKISGVIWKEGSEE